MTAIGVVEVVLAAESDGTTSPEAVMESSVHPAKVTPAYVTLSVNFPSKIFASSALEINLNSPALTELTSNMSVSTRQLVSLLPSSLALPPTSLLTANSTRELRTATLKLNTSNSRS